MPELPEVETIKRFLEKKLLGQTITDIQILTPKSFPADPKLVIGQTIRSFNRLGKQLSIHLSNQLILLIHLKMTGQLVYLNGPNKSTRIIFKFNDHSRLYFNDQRKFGWIKILTQKQLSQFQQDLGLDIFDPKFTPNYLFNQLHSTTRPVKLALLNQSKFAGIGNIYANDALFLAKIHPKTRSNTASRSKALSLYRSLISIMTQSVTHGGSTAKDSQYLLPDGSTGSHQFHFQVYQRAGEPCRVCRTPIHRLALGGRGTFYCPKCQPFQ